MDIEVVIEGVADERLAGQIKQQIRQVCKDTARSGEWRVVMSLSETRGQWDLGVRGPLGPRFGSFAERVDRLPELVAENLRACLEHGAESGPLPILSRADPA